MIPEGSCTCSASHLSQSAHYQESFAHPRLREPLETQIHGEAKRERQVVIEASRAPGSPPGI